VEKLTHTKFQVVWRNQIK